MPKYFFGAVCKGLGCLSSGPLCSLSFCATCCADTHAKEKNHAQPPAPGTYTTIPAKLLRKARV